MGRWNFLVQRSLAWALMVALVLPLAPALTTSSQAQAGLFTAATPPVHTPSAQSPSALRTQSVTINLPLLDAVQAPGSAPRGTAPTLLLNLFPDVAVTGVRDRLEPTSSGQGFIWSGKVAGDPTSQVTLIVENGVMAGNIRMGGALYQVRYAGGNLHTVSEVNERALPDDRHLPVGSASAPAPPFAAPATPLVAQDDGSTIDVMVVYTPAAVAEAGGPTAINTQVDLALAETNQAYLNSGVTSRQRLVYKGQVTYTESGNLNTDLPRLQSTSDGFLDEVHTLRNTWGADLVALWVAGDPNVLGGCGISYIDTTPGSSFASYAFSVAVRTCATGNYTHGHETGHALGACHDWIQDGRCSARDAWAHGYIAPNNAFRTIMSYGSSCGNCPRIQYFSNLVSTYGSQPVGTSHTATNPADNASEFNGNATIVANFRACVVSPCGGAVPTATATALPTRTPLPSATATLLATSTPPATAVPTYTATAVTTPTRTPTAAPSFTPSASPTPQLTATSTRTPLPTPTSTRTPLPTATTAPRGNGRKNNLTTTPSGDGSLQVTVAVDATACGASNQLQALRFGETGGATNAVVDLPQLPGVSVAPALPGATQWRGRQGTFTVTLPAGTQQLTFTVRRPTAGGSSTLPFTLVDNCGSWPTFVGGGPGAF